MSQFDGYDDEDLDQDDAGPKGLRAALKKAQAELAAAVKEKDTLSKQVADLAAKEKSRSLTDILASKGVSPKIAKFVEKDGVDPTEEAVSAWLDENADVFNIKTESAPEGDGAENTEGAGQSDPFAGMPDEVKAILAAMQQTQATEAGGSSANGEDGQTDAAIAAIGSQANSEADITAALKALGAPISG